MNTPAGREPNADTSASLRPVLGLFSAVTIVVGGVIGSGIFFKPSQVAVNTGGYVGVILTLWVVLGLVNLCGALAIGELSAMFPRAGGSYVFLREAYSPLWAFTWAWAEFCVIRSGSIATLAAAMTVTLSRIARLGGYAEWGSMAKISVAVGSIVTLSAINIVGTRWGGAVQNVTTVIKGAFIIFLAALPFVAINSQPVDLGALWPADFGTGYLFGIGSAVSGIMWAYDGWNHLPVMAEEVRQPERNIPRALFGGLLLLIVLYAAANLAYHLTLTSEEIAAAGATPTAELAAERLWPNFGGKLTLSMLVISVFGALNTNILAGPRVVFAAARDHRFLGPLRRVDPRFGTPALAIAALAGWSVLLVVAGEFLRHEKKPLYDVLSDYCIFGASLFYLAAVLGVFVLRWRRPDATRPYRTWGYPVVPAIFVGSYVVLLISMFRAARGECTIGLLLIAVGIVVYFIATGWERRRIAKDSSR